MPGNVWLVNATDFGHADYLDQIYCDTIEVSPKIIFNIRLVSELTHFTINMDKTSLQRNSIDSLCFLDV